jgi:glutamine synthetase
MSAGCADAKMGRERLPSGTRDDMPGRMTLSELRADFEVGEIDTVIVAAVDMQGRLMGKRFHAAHFLDHGWQETHCCNYLLTVDM